MVVIAEELLSHVREQADGWLKGPALKEAMYTMIAETIRHDPIEDPIKESIPVRQLDEGATAKSTPPPMPPDAPASGKVEEDPQAPRGGDMAADAAAGAHCVASEQASQLGSNLHLVKDTEKAEEPAEEPAPPPAPDAPQPGGFSVEDTLLIFDWDDTILPSSWVSAQKQRLDPQCNDLTPDHRAQLAQIAEATTNTIRSAKEHGEVIIITNAERGWVELTCHKFLPTLAPLLEGIRIISARSSYEHIVGPNPQDWKLRAFEDEIQRMYGESVHDPDRSKNVLSLGDSVHEREAVMRATATLPNCRCKSLKFTTKPDIGQIFQQHFLIKESFSKIIEHDGNLDLCLKCS